MTRDSASAAETEQLGATLASALVAGEVVLISGELGAGKTTFVRGACRALGVTDPVTSPTFAIGHLYAITGPAAPAGVSEVSHLDLYRLSGMTEEDPDLLADYVRADTIAFVEWPQAGAAELEELATVTRRVRLSHAGGDNRLVEID